MTSIISSWCNGMWCFLLNLWCNGFIERINFGIKSLMKCWIYWFLSSHTNAMVDLTFGPIIGYEHHGFHMVIWYFIWLKYFWIYIVMIWKGAVHCTADMITLHGFNSYSTLAHLGINVCLVSRATYVCFGETCEHLVLHLPCPAPSPFTLLTVCSLLWPL